MIEQVVAEESVELRGEVEPGGREGGLREQVPRERGCRGRVGACRGQMIGGVGGESGPRDPACGARELQRLVVIRERESLVTQRRGARVVRAQERGERRQGAVVARPLDRGGQVVGDHGIQNPAKCRVVAHARTARIF